MPVDKNNFRALSQLGPKNIFFPKELCLTLFESWTGFKTKSSEDFSALMLFKSTFYMALFTERVLYYNLTLFVTWFFKLSLGMSLEESQCRKLVGILVILKLQINMMQPVPWTRMGSLQVSFKYSCKIFNIKQEHIFCLSKHIFITWSPYIQIPLSGFNVQHKLLPW